MDASGPMPPRLPGDSGLAAFLRTWFEDEERGAPRTLADYQALHPGHATEIAEAYAELARTRRLRATAAEGPADGAERAAGEAVGPWRLLRELGRGGQASVWLARDTRIEREVALKLIPLPPGAEGDAAAARLRREAEAAARLDHPAICPIHEFGRDGAFAWLAMPHLRGRTLAAVLAAARASAAASAAGPATRPDRDTMLAIVEGAARALHAAHEAHLVHRDVKPGNILVRDDGRPVVLDFGLAGDLRPGAASLTRTGAILGTIPYMSPEQIRAGPEPLDRRTDVWSLGVTLFEAVTLRLPYAAATEAEMVETVARGRVVTARSVDRSIPRDLDTVLARALEADPARRFRTAEDFGEELRRIRERRPILSRPAGPVTRLGRWIGRRPGAAAAGLGVALSLAAGLAVALVLLSRTAEARREAADLAERRRGDLEEILRLADAKRVQDLLREEADLWPALPELIPSLAAWIGRARELLGNQAAHRESRARLAEETKTAPTDASWSWRLQVLDRLLEDLESARAALPSVEERLAFASTVVRRTVEDRREEWEAARNAIRDGGADSPYAGLDLRPQTGLVPLGLDPESGLLEFAHLASGEPAARHAGTGRIRLGSATGLVLVLLPGGTFTMGAERPAPDGSSPARQVDPAAEALEGPAHEVRLDPFFISRFEVSQEQWMRWTGRNPSRHRKGGGSAVGANHPVESVTWGDARRAALRLGLDLPTEARWEYAARGGTSTPWWTGSDSASIAGAANVKDQSLSRVIGEDLHLFEKELDDGFASHAPVDALLPNPFGLHGIIGNVQEWCLDSFGTYRDPVRAGDGLRVAPEDGYRVFRGGSYLQLAWNARSSNRAKVQETITDFTLGLRPTRSLDR